jgi:hypothetical protein
MTVKRYILLNAGIAGLSGVFVYPVVKMWEGLKRIYGKIR